MILQPMTENDDTTTYDGKWFMQVHYHYYFFFNFFQMLEGINSSARLNLTFLLVMFNIYSNSINFTTNFLNLIIFSLLSGKTDLKHYKLKVIKGESTTAIKNCDITTSVRLRKIYDINKYIYYNYCT